MTLVEDNQILGTFEDLINSDYGWEDDEDIFYEDLYSSIWDPNFKELDEEWKGDLFTTGDIIMVNESNLSTSGSNFTKPHRVYIISATENSEGIQTYTGYELSSAVDRSNKLYINNSRSQYSTWWKRNIYINNYSTILKSGATSNKPIFIDLGTKYTFTNLNMSDSGVKKGEATSEFTDFVNNVVNKIKRGEDTSKIYWIK